MPSQHTTPALPRIPASVLDLTDALDFVDVMGSLLRPTRALVEAVALLTNEGRSEAACSLASEAMTKLEQMHGMLDAWLDEARAAGVS
jgi:hypothetical protein